LIHHGSIEYRVLNKAAVSRVELSQPLAEVNHQHERRKMAKVTLHPSIGAMSGKLGDMVYRRLWGQEITSRLPDFSKRKLSEKQRAQVGRFTTGSVKWKGLPVEVQARYKARAKELEMPPCALYQKTNARPPSVEDIDLSQYTGQAGQFIRVGAVDLVDVAGVEVIIREAGGNQLEAGSATRPPEGNPYWIYQTTAAASSAAGVTVEATAANWPGKRASRMQMRGASAP
jgi:hypothetical protein